MTLTDEKILIDHSNHALGGFLDDLGRRIGVSPKTPFPVAFTGPGADVGGRARVTIPTTLFANKNIHTKHDTEWSEVTSGGTETITFNYSSSCVDLTVGTASGEYALRQSVRYVPYDPGKTQFIKVTFRAEAHQTNQRIEIGYGDDNNGLFLVRDDNGIGFLIRTDTSGTPSDANIKYQDEWNGDKLDGTGLSGITLDLTKNHLLWIDFLWQGVGDVRFGFLIDGNFIVCHTFTHSNVSIIPYMRTPSLPIRYKIENTGVVASGATLSEICSDVESEGGYAPPGLKWSVAGEITSRVGVTTRRPILAIRHKTAISGNPNRRAFKIIDAGFSTTTNDALFELVHIHNPTGITATWSDVDTDSSGLEYSTDISAITGGDFHIVDHQFASTGTGNKAQGFELGFDTVDGHQFLSQNFDSSNSEIFAIYATAEAGTADTWSHITGRDFE